MLSCGLTITGYATYCCSNRECSHQKKVPFSCHSRFCPTCGKKATDQWIEKQQRTLPDTEWQHITFTMPSELWTLFKLNRSLLKDPSRLAARTIKKVAKKKGIVPGIFTALHTFGRDLKWNVHIHLSVTCGGLVEEHSQWKSLYFVKQQIMPMWRYEIINLLRQSYASLVLPEAIKQQCTTQEQFNQWLDQHYRKAWIVHFAKPSKNHHRNVKYLGRYIKRPPLSLSRLVHYDGKRVIFNYLNHTTDNHEQATFEAEEFIARFTQHIPDKHFRLINYYGFLANRVRGKLLPIVYQLLDQSEKLAQPLRWASLLKQSFGTDPLECILCGSRLLLSHLTFGKSAYEMRRYHCALAQAKLIA